MILFYIISVKTLLPSHCAELNNVFSISHRKRILANGVSSKTSQSNRPASPHSILSRQSFGVTPSSLMSSVTPLTSEKGQSAKTGFQFRKSIASVVSLDNNSVFEDSDCIINGVETPGGSWNSNSFSETRKFDSKSDKCYSGPSFNESNNQTADAENIGLFFSPRRPVGSESKAKTNTTIANGTNSRADTEPDDDFLVDDFDIDDFDETDIPDYYEEPRSVLTSRGNSSAVTPSVREGGASKPVEKKTVITPTPQPTKPKQIGEF